MCSWVPGVADSKRLSLTGRQLTSPLMQTSKTRSAADVASNVVVSNQPRVRSSAADDGASSKLGQQQQQQYNRQATRSILASGVLETDIDEDLVLPTAFDDKGSDHPRRLPVVPPVDSGEQTPDLHVLFYSSVLV